MFLAEWFSLDKEVVDVPANIGGKWLFWMIDKLGKVPCWMFILDILQIEVLSKNGDKFMFMIVIKIGEVLR